MKTTDQPDQPEFDPFVVLIERARCPECGGTNLQTQHTDQNGDGSVTRRTKCRDCGLGFKVVCE